MTRLCLALWLWGAAATAAVVPELAVESYDLANGLHVILHQDHRLPTVAVNIWYHVGSKDEKPGRTGFAHLFEHMMFQGAAHYDDDYFLPLQKIGGTVNGSTNQDRTNYWENVPADQLKRALFLEADRMGGLLPALTAAKLDNQRDVVKNEKRQGENRPYGRSRELLYRMLYPAGHPYRNPVIGSMADLSAATLGEVSDFFGRYYAPNNASLCVVGDFDPEQTRQWIEAYFGSIPAGPPLVRVTRWTPSLDGEKRAVAEDAVALPRLYMAWHTPPYYAPGDAEFDLLGKILTGSKTARLHRRLVFETGVAQDVTAFQSSRELGGVFELRATVAPGHTLVEVEAVIDDELAKLLAKGVTGAEVELARAAVETQFARGLQRQGGFGGVADRLNRYHVLAGDDNYLARDLARYRAADARSVGQYVRQFLDPERRAVLRVAPRGDFVTTEPDSALGSLPGSTGAVAFTPPVVQTAALANGLKIYVVEEHGLPLVEARLQISSGWANAEPSVAALTAELLDEGAGGRDALKLARAVEKIGARLRTFSSFHASTVSLNVLREHLDRGMVLLRDVVRKPRFEGADLARLRRSYLGRQQQEKSQPRQQAIKELQRRCFAAGQAYGRPYTGSGTRESVLAVSRDDIVAFHRLHYRPDNAALIFVGDITLTEAQALAVKAFGDWQPGDQPIPARPASDPATDPAVVVIDRPGAPQSFVVAGCATISRQDPDYLPMSVVNEAFGGQFASRINLNLREDKGYTYGVRSEVLSWRDGGLFIIAAPVETAVTVASVRELIDEMTALNGSHPLQGAELADSRNRLIMGFPGKFTTYSRIAAGVGTLRKNGLPLDEWQTYASRVTAIDRQIVARAAKRRLIPERLVWVIVGDWQEIGPGLEALGLGEIEVLSDR